MKQGSSTGPYRKGHWSVEEDIRLIQFVRKYGEGRWSKLAKAAGLQRCGKSCRLRWVNYLRPDIKRGHISEEEERIIIELHSMLGNRWSLIALHLPGRSDNEIKNYWRSHIKKKLKLEDTSNGDNHSGAIDCISSEASQSGEGCDFAMIDGACYNMMGLEGSTNTQLENLEHSIDCQNLQEEDYYHLHHALHKFENVLNNETTNLPSLITNYESMSDENHFTQSIIEGNSRNSTYELISDREVLDRHLLQDHKNKAIEGSIYESYNMSTPYSLAQNAIQGVINMPVSNCGEDLTFNEAQREPWVFYPARESKVPIHNLNSTHCIALSLHDSDVPWDVETIQPIAEAQNTSHAGIDNNYSFELWDNELLPHVEPNLHGDKK